MDGVNSSPTVVPFFFRLSFDKIKGMGHCRLVSLVTDLCKTFLNLRKPPDTLGFIEIQDTLLWCKYAPYLFSFICMPFWSNEWLFFFLEIYNVLFSGNLQRHSGLFQCFIRCINQYPFTIKTVVIHLSGFDSFLIPEHVSIVSHHTIGGFLLPPLFLWFRWMFLPSECALMLCAMIPWVL